MVFGHQADQATPPTVPLEVQPLTELAFLRGLLARVEQLWQVRARAALRGGPSGNPLARWNVASSAGIEMVRAHARLQAADAFLAAIARTTEPGARALLEDLCRLFLLQELTSHTGDLLAEGHLAPAHVRELPAAVDLLMERLAPQLPVLVEAFDLPEAFLARIPLANDGHSLMLDGFLAAEPEPSPPLDLSARLPRQRPVPSAFARKLALLR